MLASRLESKWLPDDESLLEPTHFVCAYPYFTSNGVLDLLHAFDQHHQIHLCSLGFAEQRFRQAEESVYICVYLWLQIQNQHCVQEVYWFLLRFSSGHASVEIDFFTGRAKTDN